jgi:hypothetical protein
MRRFIISSVVALSLCVGGSTMAQAAVYKQVTTKTVVEKTIVEKSAVVVHVAPVHYEHFTSRHFVHSFYRFHR